MRRWWHGFVAFVVIATGLVPGSAASAAPDVITKLRAVPGLTVVADKAGPPGYWLFSLTYRQPIDHRQPSRGSFNQRFTLLHKATDQPMVLHTGGYGVYFTSPFRDEPTFLLGSNQISVEQRFFTPSRPSPVDWTVLTIWQAATDHHRIVEALKPIYAKKWISAGASKGGMTSIYHRRFYPNDVAGTVAYVAPNDAVNSSDAAYTQFFNSVGTDPACRKKLADLQRESLRRRADLVSRFSSWAQANGRTFNRSIGTADKAFEMMVLDTPWYFWQYKAQHYCRNVPPVTATSEQILNYMNYIAGFDSFTDQGVEFYIPYYHQAGTQLGYPSFDSPHLAGLLRYPGLYSPRSYVPRDIPMSFDTPAMADIDTWVRQQGSQLLFVYGQNDPWGAEPFRLGPGTRDSLWFSLAGGNHGAEIGDLPTAERSAATAALRRWAGLPAVTGSGYGPGDRYIPGLDDRARRQEHRRL